MATNEGTSKEQTVRELIDRCWELFRVLRSALYEKFDRNPKDSSEEGACTRPSNILDEITNDLGELSHDEERLIEFVRTQIINKL